MNNKFELSTPVKKRRYSLEGLKSDDENFSPENVRDDLSRPVVINKLKQNEFDDVNIMRKY